MAGEHPPYADRQADSYTQRFDHPEQRGRDEPAAERCVDTGKCSPMPTAPNRRRFAEAMLAEVERLEAIASTADSLYQLIDVCGGADSTGPATQLSPRLAG